MNHITAVLRSIAHPSYSSEDVMGLIYRILLKSQPPNLTVWIHPCTCECLVEK